MNKFLLLITLLVGLSTSHGQGLGIQSGGGEVVWTDNIESEVDTTIIAISDSSPPFPLHPGYFEEGAGGAVGGSGSDKSASQGEFESRRVSYGGDHFISEGSPFDISCTLTVFDHLKWTLNGRPIKFQHNGYTVAEIPAPQGFIGSRLSVANSEKKHAGSYKCTTFSPLSHTIYILSADESVGIDCRSKFHNSPKDSADGPCSNLRIVKWHAEGTETTKLLRLGQPMAVECKITARQANDTNLKMDLIWFKDDEPIERDDSRFKIYPENSTLLILAPTVDDVGVYRCKTVSFRPAQSYNISIVYLAVKSMPKSMTVLEGDKLSIACEVEGNPMPTITWLKDNVDVEEVVNSSRYELYTSEKGIKNATYVVEKAIYEDRANYTCFIASGDIHYNTTTFVRVKDMYAALWPFLGICAEVFILCLIIFVYEKRRAKNDFEESDTDQPPEQKNPCDHNKDSVRHRK